MNLMSTMEHTLHIGLHTGPLKVKPRAELHKLRWPREFRRPVDAALHLGTPKTLEVLRQRKSECADVFFFD